MVFLDWGKDCGVGLIVISSFSAKITDSSFSYSNNAVQKCNVLSSGVNPFFTGSARDS
jgi:hypothetical protein